MKTYTDLIDFLENKMKMAHIYQPLLIKILLESEGYATIRQIAQGFLSKDESQIDYYQKRIKEMPVKVLKNHDVIEHDGQLITLNLNMKKLTFQDKSKLKEICDRKIQDYFQKRGLSIWDHRLLDDSPISDVIRYEVLKRADGRCELCGITKKDRPLDIDHIIPRSRGGKNDITNLQILCSKCNRSKGNKDDTDFRNNISERLEDCLFCSDEFKKRTVETNESVFAVFDGFPVTEGHHLIIPFRHTPDYFSTTQEERLHTDQLLRVLKNKLLQEDSSITGFNIGMNSGLSAGQSIFHAHTHLIPRRDGDMETPKGGVRGVIPEKMGY